MSDPFDLDRFVSAQAATIGAARRELAAGAKRSHWMWFMFPQVEGLGRSMTARRYAIRSGDEARAYLDHDVLGPRLTELTTLALDHADPGPERLFGGIDALKFRSSMTLFDGVSEFPLFGRALDAFHGGQRCPLTLEWLEVHG